MTGKEMIKQFIEAGVGKRMPAGLYIHVSALHLVPTALEIVYEARRLAGGVAFNVVKIPREGESISLLWYRGFDAEAFPVLWRSTTVDLATGQASTRRHDTNPPILHRKELLVETTYPNRNRWIRNTRIAVNAGAFLRPSKIGRLREWIKITHDCGIRVIEDQVVEMREGG